MTCILWYDTVVLAVWSVWFLFILAHAITHRSWRVTESNGYFDSGTVTYREAFWAGTIVGAQLAVFALVFILATASRRHRQRRLRIASIVLAVVDVPLGLIVPFLLYNLVNIMI